MKFSLNFGALVDGLSVFLIGVSMVFVVLLLLIFLIKLVGWIVNNIENKAKEQRDTDVPVAVSQEVETAVKPATQIDDLELVAVITAAIAATLGTTADQLQVRSLRQVNRRKA